MVFARDHSLEQLRSFQCSVVFRISNSKMEIFLSIRRRILSQGIDYINKKISQSGSRTRALWVKATNPNR